MTEISVAQSFLVPFVLPDFAVLDIVAGADTGAGHRANNLGTGMADLAWHIDCLPKIGKGIDSLMAPCAWVDPWLRAGIQAHNVIDRHILVLAMA
jgi:hypothetical protein